MTRINTTYICQNCGAQSRQFFGRCPRCNNWDSFVTQASSSNHRATKLYEEISDLPIAKYSKPIDQVKELFVERLSSGYNEFDRVLGGGFVPGSLVLVGGEPGIGKSTLLLQSAMIMSRYSSILYVSAEESAQQVKLRWRRLNECKNLTNFHQENKTSQLHLMAETELEIILQELQSFRPAVAVIDSIQAIYTSGLSSAPGSLSQVRECSLALQKLAKQQGTAILLVGHVTKEGTFAGPKVLEHLVDAVITFEGDRFGNNRLLRAIKNRFGANYELGVFEMGNQGLVELTNPFEIFLGRNKATTGVATIVAYEGTRPLLVEVQALINTANYGNPRRITIGISTNRLHQILAVLEKHMGFRLSSFDCYLAVAGGVTVQEPAADLGAAAAIVASYNTLILPPKTVFIGELGLSGKLRPVTQIPLRLRECARLGFDKVVMPKIEGLENIAIDLNISLLQVETVMEAIIFGLGLE
uniref:DNA repair protein RadA n=1 Tax=Paulinella chromatophora TaxID=39717 RepID=B1X477_PAUCH|nr:DNA repair protein RadA [Paulinella chromatophora]ACB42746.1 DNA repair protein RadA [Paulinella chromatophora]